MAVETLTAFPASFYAGTTLRIALSDSNYPSSDWTLKVVMRGPSGEVFTFPATTEADDAYEVVISATASAKMGPGRYGVTFIYIDSGEVSAVASDAITVFSDPSKASAKSLNRQTLEAMKEAFLKLAKGSNQSVSFNGQSFTKKTLTEFQNAIDRQQAIVNAEEQTSSGAGSLQRILHPL